MKRYDLVVRLTGPAPGATVVATCDAIQVDNDNGDVCDLLVNGAISWTVRCERIVSIRLEEKQ